MTMTQTTLATELGHDIPTHLLDAEIPVVTGPQVQGDVFVLPIKGSAAMRKGATPIPAEGVVVVRGENGGNTHALFGAGRFTHATPTRQSLALGTLCVDEGEVAYLHHPEHGYNAIGAGTYQLRRQREQAEEIRIVAD